MASGNRKTSKPLIRGEQAQREAAKRIAAISKQIERTGRLRNPKTGAFIKADAKNIRKVSKEITRDLSQTKKTAKAAASFIKNVKSLFSGVKSSKPTAKPSKPASQSSKPKKAAKKQPSNAPKKSASRVSYTPSKSSGQSSKPKKAAPKPAQKSKSKKATKPSGKPPAKPSKKQVQGSAPRSTSKRTKKLPKFSPKSDRQRIYDISEMPEAFRNKTVYGTLEELLKHADEYNALLKPGEMFGGRVGYTDKQGVFHGGYTHRIFPNFQEYIKKMMTYGFVGGEAYSIYTKDQLLDMLQIIRFKAPGIKQPTTAQTARAWFSNKQTKQNAAIARYNDKVTAKKVKDKERNKKLKDAERTIAKQAAEIKRLQKRS